jgi:Cysteine-rich CWC
MSPVRQWVASAVMSQRDDLLPPEDKSLCVVCGEPNECALEREGGAGDDACWCVSEVFPRPLVAWLAEEKDQQRCLCRNCLARHRAGELIEGESS